jgi:hypothetical protein
VLSEEGESQPIPSDPPEGFFDSSVFHVDGIGEPSTACFLTRMNNNPANWYGFAFVLYLFLCFVVFLLKILKAIIQVDV